MPITKEELVAIAKSKGVDVSKYEQALQGQQGGQAQPMSDLQGLMQPSGNGMSSPIAQALMMVAGKKPSDYQNQDSDLSKLYAQEAIKSRFEDPTVRQLREAEIKSLGQPLPEGLTRVGRQVVSDPAYIKPAEQAKLDEDVRQRGLETESLRASAEDNLATIQKVKEGADYFGPLGGLPTLAAPSTYLPGGGNYASRKEWENNTNKLLSQKVIDIISEMKRVSKTGATGFGQLSEKEGAILQQASTALSRDLPKEQALYYLNEMEKIHKKVLGGGSSQGQRPNAPQLQPGQRLLRNKRTGETRVVNG